MLSEAEAPKMMKQLPRRYAHSAYHMMQAATLTAFASSL